jgi:hypothetical protein
LNQWSIDYWHDGVLQNFQEKAVETLNAMTPNHANKTSKEYQGEFLIICGSDNLYRGIHNAFQWYETSDLVNPDTGNKMKDDCKEKWVRRLTKAFAFKCLRGLGVPTLLELVQKITAGLTAEGELDKESNEVPKVYLGPGRSLHCQVENHVRTK